MPTLILQCSEQKSQVPAPAKELYQSQLFREMRNYAETTGCPWVVFSARHGLVSPDQILAPYDTTLGSLEQVRVDVLRGQLPQGELISLCGKAYNGLLTRAGAVYSDPLKGLGCGQRQGIVIAISRGIGGGYVGDRGEYPPLPAVQPKYLPAYFTLLSAKQCK